MSSPAAPAQLPAVETATPARTVVHKFGGTSVADAERYRHVAQLLLAREESLQVTVVSAMKGVTDALIELARMAGAEAGAGQGGADWTYWLQNYPLVMAVWGAIMVVLTGIYAFAGICAAIAGIIVAGDIRGADANNAGLWLELDAILAVVIGGTSLLGGRFSIPMSVMGALIIQAMNTGILISGFPPEFNLMVKAGIIILILVLQSPFATRQLARRRPATGRGRAERTLL